MPLTPVPKTVNCASTLKSAVSAKMVTTWIQQPASAPRNIVSPTALPAIQKRLAKFVTVDTSQVMDSVSVATNPTVRNASTPLPAKPANPATTSRMDSASTLDRVTALFTRDRQPLPQAACSVSQVTLCWEVVATLVWAAIYALSSFCARVPVWMAQLLSITPVTFQILHSKDG